MQRTKIALVGILFGAVLLFILTLLFYHAPSKSPSQLPLPAGQGQFELYQASMPKLKLENSPNILLVLLDDVGFGQPAPFGGPVEMPTLEKLSQNGLRYTQFHTAGLCDATRAALLTGHNHHAVGAGTQADWSLPFPGYNAIWPRSIASIAEILQENGYSTAIFGKWSNTPIDETSPIGPFENWPVQKGFQYFYGFIGEDTNQWYPALIENTKPIARSSQQTNYHLSSDLADRAITWLNNQHSIHPNKPFFIYFAPGAAHAPHQIYKSWADKYKGKFEDGWDTQRETILANQIKLGIVPDSTVLTSRPDFIPAWNALSADERHVYSRMEEVFAGFLNHADEQVGRIINAIAGMGKLDHTLIIYLAGDNGPSAEGSVVGSINELNFYNHIKEDFQTNFKMVDDLGGASTYNHYPIGWAWAGATPFFGFKQTASHLGGVRNGLVISWPEQIKDKGGIRTQFHHVIDIVPTILEAAHIPLPSVVNGVFQKPMEGMSMVYSFSDSKAPSPRTMQYFEIENNRALYKQGLMAVNLHHLPGETNENGKNERLDKWELYDITQDFSEIKDLAETHPTEIEHLRNLWWAEAGRHQVLPLPDHLLQRIPDNQANLNNQNHFSFTPATYRLPEGCAPDFKNRSFSITADILMPPTGAEGVIVTQGGRFGGWALYVKNEKLIYVYNYLNRTRYVITSSEKIPSNQLSTIRFDFNFEGHQKGAGGIGHLFINDHDVGQVQIEQTIPLRMAIDETFDVGRDTGTPICDDYELPFKFTGELRKVEIDLKEKPSTL